MFVALMEMFLPNPPVTRSLLELLAVSNVTTQNAIQQFVSQPRPFTAENASIYMQKFRVKDTIAQFMGRSVPDDDLHRAEGGRRLGWREKEPTEQVAIEAEERTRVGDLIRSASRGPKPCSRARNSRSGGSSSGCTCTSNIVSNT
jgi:hypothetical protein